NVYAYNGESYNPNIRSQYLRARYYNVATAAFLTEDSYLGEIMRPLTLNRYGYCLGNPVNYVDPSGHITTVPYLPTGEYAARKVLHLSNDKIEMVVTVAQKTKTVSEKGLHQVQELSQRVKTVTSSYAYGKLSGYAQACFDAYSFIVPAIVNIGHRVSGKHESLSSTISLYNEVSEEYINMIKEKAENKSAYYLGRCSSNLEIMTVGIVGMWNGLKAVASGVVGSVVIGGSSGGTLSAVAVADIPVVLAGVAEITVTGIAAGYGAYHAMDDFDKLRENLNGEMRGEVTFPEDEAQIKHIFRDKEGHILDTPENRKKILDVANDPDNYIGKDGWGNDWYAKISEDGTQTWVRARNGIINNAGVNDIPREWDPQTGLYSNKK
ncbi:MAG: hypothetical protein HDR26_00345, partial [Lachnospiraceae bacterium]|nr:hypothetical protein [Lachnospiraceae bacterium]